MQVKTVDISTLKPWEGNPRLHGDDVQDLVRSIEHFGFTNPILVQSGTNRIIAGHGRYLASKRKGLKTVPVIELDFDDDKAAAYTVADNKLAEKSTWDKALLKKVLDGMSDVNITGFSEDEFKAMVDGISGNADDPYPAMALEPFEHYDYVVLFFKTSMDFLQACDVLKIKKVKEADYKKGKDGKKVRVGIGRSLDGAEFIKRICKSK